VQCCSKVSIIWPRSVASCVPKTLLI
jgi:hypothetical protein